MTAQAIGARLAAVYRDIEATAMRDAPICNAALQVEAIGFCEFGGVAVGIILTPWFLSLVATELRPGEAPVLPIGALRLRFPAGPVELAVTELEGFGRLASCSLFSPLFEFADQEAARATAKAALVALFDSKLHDPDPASLPTFDRRAFFGAPRPRPGATS